MIIILEFLKRSIGPKFQFKNNVIIKCKCHTIPSSRILSKDHLEQKWIYRQEYTIMQSINKSQTIIKSLLKYTLPNKCHKSANQANCTLKLQNHRKEVKTLLKDLLITIWETHYMINWRHPTDLARKAQIAIVAWCSKRKNLLKYIHHKIRSSIKCIINTEETLTISI